MPDNVQRSLGARKWSEKTKMIKNSQIQKAEHLRKFVFVIKFHNFGEILKNVFLEKF